MKKMIWLVLVIILVGLSFVSYKLAFSEKKDPKANLEFSGKGIMKVSGNKILYNLANTETKFPFVEFRVKNIQNTNIKYIDSICFDTMSNDKFRWINEFEVNGSNTFRSDSPSYPVVQTIIIGFDKKRGKSEKSIVLYKIIKIDQNNIQDLNTSNFFKGYSKMLVSKNKNYLSFTNKDNLSRIYSYPFFDRNYEAEYIIKSTSDGYAIMISGLYEYLQVSNKKVEFVSRGKERKIQKEFVVDTKNIYEASDFNKWNIKREIVTKNDVKKDHIIVSLNDYEIFSIYKDISLRGYKYEFISFPGGYSSTGFSVPKNSTLTIKSYKIGEKLNF